MHNAQPQNTEAIPLSDLYSVEELANEYPNILSVATLRWQLRSRETNGLASACVILGQKLRISKTRYEQWLATQAGARRAAA